jgi:hypothetical protein
MKFLRQIFKLCLLFCYVRRNKANSVLDESEGQKDVPLADAKENRFVITWVPLFTINNGLHVS